MGCRLYGDRHGLVPERVALDPYTTSWDTTARRGVIPRASAFPAGVGWACGVRLLPYQPQLVVQPHHGASHGHGLRSAAL